MVSHGSHYQNTLGDRVGNGVTLDESARQGSKAQAEDVSAIVDGPTDTGSHVGRRTCTAHPYRICDVHDTGQNLDRHQLHVPADANHARAIVPDRTDRSRNMGAVANFILRDAVAANVVALKTKARWRRGTWQIDHVAPLNEVWLEVWVIQVNAGIKDRHNNVAAPGRAIPGSRRIDRSHPPELTKIRVIWGGRGEAVILGRSIGDVSGLFQLLCHFLRVVIAVEAHAHRGNKLF